MTGSACDYDHGFRLLLDAYDYIAASRQHSFRQKIEAGDILWSLALRVAVVSAGSAWTADQSDKFLSKLDALSARVKQ